MAVPLSHPTLDLSLMPPLEMPFWGVSFKGIPSKYYSAILLDFLGSLLTVYHKSIFSINSFYLELYLNDSSSFSLKIIGEVGGLEQYRASRWRTSNDSDLKQLIKEAIRPISLHHAEIKKITPSLWVWGLYLLIEYQRTHKWNHINWCSDRVLCGLGSPCYSQNCYKDSLLVHNNL